MSEIPRPFPVFLHVMLHNSVGAEVTSHLPVLGLEGEKVRDAHATADSPPSKASVCIRSIAGIAGSNPAEGTDVRLFSLFCVV
jgi:hypothetical protein